MKLTLITIFALFAATYATFVDRSSVKNTCEKGCFSKLKVTLKVTGRGSTKRAAKRDCVSKCVIPGGDRIKTCGDLCNLDIPPFAAKAKRSFARSKTCALCGGDPGRVARICKRKLDRLERKCRKDCRRGTPFFNSKEWLKFSSRTLTKKFAGDKSQC